MRAYPLRLPDELADTARQQAERLGISFNAFVAVALDAYIRAGSPIQNKSPDRPKPASKASKPSKPSKPKAPKPAPVQQPEQPQRVELWHPDPRNWRNFHDPEQWPYRDPDWTWPKHLKARFDRLDFDDVDPADMRALEDAYWATHEKPDRPLLAAGEVPY